VCPPYQHFCMCILCAGTFLRSYCLATAVSSCSTLPTFRHRVTLHSKVAGGGVLYAVRILSHTQYVVKGK
jgi:hypothetical protein